MINMNNLSKIRNQTPLLDELKKMLHHFEYFNFINTANVKKHSFLQCNGENLKENIKKEWLISNSISCDEPSFCCSTLNTKEFLANAFTKILPFIEEVPCNISACNDSHSQKLLKSNGVTDNNPEHPTDILNEHFNNENGTILQRYLLCNPAFSRDFFYKLQRERKLWWKKFSASPGRFNLSQAYNDKDDSQVVEIQAQFLWGTAIVERIKVLPEVFGKAMSYMSPRHQKEIIPTVICSETPLEKSVLTFLCDSYEAKYGGLERKVLRLHRKLAIYKVAFAGISSDASMERDLKELGLLLAKKIRSITIPVLLLPNICSLPIEEQIMRNDSLGIPLTIIMDEKTLNNGMLGIRCRDTTLQEQSHVSLVVSYVEKLMKNY